MDLNEKEFCLITERLKNFFVIFLTFLCAKKTWINSTLQTSIVAKWLKIGLNQIIRNPLHETGCKGTYYLSRFIRSEFLNIYLLTRDVGSI